MKHFDRFGVMIDCSRGAVPNMEGLRKFIKILSDMGYNMVMLYTEDTYEIEGEPYFGYKRGRYTSDELKALDDYADSLGVEMIPCIQTLAHLGSIFRWQAYQPIRDTADILLVEDEATYSLIDKMFKAARKSFRSKIIHIGMDEAHAIGLGKYLDQHGYQNRFELLSRHLDRVSQMAKDNGFEPLMWEDMYFKFVRESGDYRSNYILPFPEDVKRRVPKNVTMVYWDYYADSEEYYDNMIKSSYNLCDKVWFAGGAWTWNGFTPRNRRSIKRSAMSIPACIKNGVRNAFLTLWGDNGGECPYETVLPTLMHAIAVAEGLSEEEMKRRFLEITGESYDHMLSLDLPNHIFGEAVEIDRENYAKVGLYDDPFLGIWSDNERAKEGIFATYRDMLQGYADSSKQFSYLYETQSALCYLLALKYSLAARTRALYADKNKGALKALAEQEYAEVIIRLEAFYKAYRTQWYTVNKPQGFEVHTARLGGLMQRLKDCRDRLLLYCDGLLDTVSELDEAAYPTGDTMFTSYSGIVNACGL